MTLQKPVALFSLEMSKAEIAQRLLCSVGKVDSAAGCALGKLEDGDWTRVTGAHARRSARRRSTSTTRAR